MNLLEKIEAALDSATPPVADLLREFEAYVRAGMDQQPTAWVLEFMSPGGDISHCLSWQKSGAGVCNRLEGSEHEMALFTHPNHPIPPVGECEELLLIAHMDGYYKGKQDGQKVPDGMQLPSDTIEKLLDAAFHQLQHDTGEDCPEYVWQRKTLKTEFRKILRYKAARGES